MPEEATRHPAYSVPPNGRLWPMIVLTVMVLIIIAAVVLVTIVAGRKSPPPVQAPIGNGQLLQIEKIAYGTNQQFGRGFSFIEKLTRQWPVKFRRLLGVDSVNRIDVSRPALVIWFSVVDEVSRTNMDCRSIRAQLVDRYGEGFSDMSSRTFGSPGNWRSAAVFYDYPKGDTNLTLQVVSFQNPSQVTSIEIPNPNVVKPANWLGKPLPQSKTVNGIEIVLSELRVQQMPKSMGLFSALTPSMLPKIRSGSSTDFKDMQKFIEDQRNARMRSTFMPVGKCLLQGKPAPGWSAPQWTSEDHFGNRSMFPGPSTNHAVIKFIATVYPDANNAAATKLLATLPRTAWKTSDTNILWNHKGSAGSNEIVVVGLFQPGTHTFSNGLYQASSSELPDLSDRSSGSIGPGNGGPPQMPKTFGSSGWEFSPRPIWTAGKTYFLRRHSTASLVIYVRAQQFTSPNRIGVRFRDDQGRSWSARAEPIYFDQIHPFYVELPPDATSVVTEVVALNPLQAEFFVDTRSSHKP